MVRLVLDLCPVSSRFLFQGYTTTMLYLLLFSFFLCCLGQRLTLNGSIFCEEVAVDITEALGSSERVRDHNTRSFFGWWPVTSRPISGMKFLTMLDVAYFLKWWSPTQVKCLTRFPLVTLLKLWTVTTGAEWWRGFLELLWNQVWYMILLQCRHKNSSLWEFTYYYGVVYFVTLKSPFPNTLVVVF